MKERRTDRSQQAANYFDEGLKAIMSKWQSREIEWDEFEAKINELSVNAQELCRKQIIQSFDMGFKLGVFWHVEMSETKQQFLRDTGTDFYRNVYEGGNK